MIVKHAPPTKNAAYTTPYRNVGDVLNAIDSCDMACPREHPVILVPLKL